MASRYEAEVTIGSAKNLKNVNWRNGDLKPYVVLWVDPAAKCSTRVADSGDENPSWDETVLIPFSIPIEDATLHIDIVHAGAAEGTKPLVGSAKLPLRDVVDDVGLGAAASSRSLKLKRPSGRPQGKLDVKICVRQPSFRQPDPYYAPPYGYGVPPGTRDYPAPPPPYAPPPPHPYGGAYGAPPPPQAYVDPYGAAPPPDAYRTAPPSGYPYGAPPAAAAPYGSQVAYGQKEKKSGKFGMGTGLAVGAAAGLLGGLAISEGVDYVEDKIADEAAERVEDDLGYDDGDF